MLDNGDEDQRQPDGGDQGRNRRRVPPPQWAKGDELDQQAEQPADEDGDDGRGQKRHSVQRNERVGDDRAQHEHRRVREVEHVEHAEDQRVTDGEQRVDRPNEDRVEDLLGQRDLARVY